MKTCTRCGAEKPLSEFYVLKAGQSGRVNPGHFPECKACNIARVTAYNKQQLAQNRQKVVANRARWSRNSRLRSYGLTGEQYDAMLAEQDGRCAICGTTDPGRSSELFPVDHDHQTGAVRGLLCHDCNLGLGNLGDDADRLMSAVAYLLAHQNVIAQVF